MLARRLEELTAEISELTSLIRGFEADLRPHIQGRVAVDAFCALEEVPEVEAVIAAKEREIDVLQNAEQIRRADEFTAVTIESFPTEQVRALLATSLNDVTADAARHVEQHLAVIGAGGEAWLADGVRRLNADNCPFCAQSVTGVQLVKDYQAYFSDQYRALKQSIAELQSRLAKGFGPATMSRLVGQFSAENDKARFWAQYIPDAQRELAPTRLAEAAQVLSATIGEAVSRKALAPLEEVLLGNRELEAITAFEAARGELVGCSVTRTSLNPEIRRIKAGVSGNTLESLNNELVRLKNARTRFTPLVAAKADDYLRARNEKHAHEQQKTSTRREIERLQLLHQIEDEEKKVRELEDWAAQWAKARQMREFIAAVEKDWTEQGGDLSPDSENGKRITWMKQQADRLDPLVASPPSILDRKGEVNRYW